jgi:hypothetical protein
MKTLYSKMLLALTFTLPLPWASGQTLTPQPGSYTVIERGPDHKVWQRTTFDTDPRGVRIARNHRYVELASGMHYLDQGIWKESSEQIVPAPGGAIARTGQHKVIFAGTLPADAAIDMQTPDGTRLRSHVLGLAYRDSASGSNVWIAEIKPCQGALAAQNQVIYSDAFDDVQASIRYTYTRAGLEQDIILQEQPPAPEEYGLDSATTKLAVWTEFLDAPVLTPVTVGQEDPDTDLSIGTMRIIRGKAFPVDQPDSNTPTTKRWVELNGRHFLIEEVPIPALAPHLQSLPQHQGAALSPGKPAHRIVSLCPAPPVLAVSKKPAAPMLLAAARAPKSGLTLDYSILVSCTNLVLQGDLTFYLSGPVNLAGTTVIEGGAVIKVAPTNAPSINIMNGGSLDWRTGPYKMAVFTCRDDNSCGETIPGSTGTPSRGPGSGISAGYVSPITARYARFSHLQTALSTYMSSTIWHCQFVDCGTAVNLGYSAALYNCLFSACSNVTCFGGSICTPYCAPSVTAQHVTADACLNLMKMSGSWNYPASLTLKNTLLTTVASLTSGWQTIITTNSSVILPISAGVYAPTGAGSYYLVANSTNRATGLATLDPSLAADLKKKTTYPPTVTTLNGISSLSQAVPRNTGTAKDIGFNYDPVDYAVSQAQITTTLTINPGTVIAGYGPSVINLWAGGGLISSAAPDNLSWIVCYNTVQEQSVSAWSEPIEWGLINDSSASPPAAAFNLRFTALSSLGQDVYLAYIGTVTAKLQDCQLHGGYLVGAPSAMFLTNCLLERVGTEIDPCDGPAPVIANNTFFGGAFYFYPCNPTAVVRDNLFDRTTIVNSGGYTGDYNAYVTGISRLLPNKPNDKILPSAPTYQTGTLGNFYQLNTSPLFNGDTSTTADQVGLYHYTTATNLVAGLQVKEQTTHLDLGFHYAATDSQGQTIDTDLDGMPDYLEDSTGNGLYDPADFSNWQDPDADADGDNLPDAWEYKYFGNLLQDGDGDYDGDGITNLDEFLNGTDPNKIKFDLVFDANHFRSNNVRGQALVTAGTPASKALLVDAVNFESATWAPYASTFTLNLGAAEGWHEVWLGLRGRPADAAQSWVRSRLKLDLTPPNLVITSPTTSTTLQPLLQIIGYCPEALAALTYDLSNDAGTVTNELAIITHTFFDTNTWEFTTNFFQCFDIELTNGINTVTLHATDLAGNSTTSTLTYTLDYSGDTTPPAITLHWPKDGTAISGDSFTCRGSLDDPSAQVTGTLTAPDGTVTTFNGLVERNGLFWLEDLPLTDGTSQLTLTATDAAGNSSTTSINVVKSSVSLTISPPADEQLNGGPISVVSGTVPSGLYAVWVNGIRATDYGDGTWLAENVPVNSGGTAILQARAIPLTDNGGLGNDDRSGHTTNADPGNPTSANARDAEAPKDVPWRVYVEKFVDNVTWDYTWYEVEGPIQSDHAFFNWEEWKPAEKLHKVTMTPRYQNRTTTDHDTWPADPWPPFHEGVEDHTVSLSGQPDEETRYSINSPLELIYYDSCNVAVETDALDWIKQYTRNAQTTMKLQTGGKGVPRKNLFAVNASVAGIGDLQWNHTPPWESALPYAISNDKVTIGELGKLGTDGNLYRALPDNTPVDITPQVGGVDYYVFGIGAVKHRLRIMANGSLLEPHYTVPSAKYAVGTKVNFEPVFVPPLPVEPQKAVAWNFTDRFINAFNVYILVDPNIVLASEDFYDSAYALNSFRVSVDRLQNEHTFCWWLTGNSDFETKDASVGMNLTFPNGQRVRIGTHGQLGIHQPSAVWEPSLYQNGVVYGRLTALGTLQVGIGTWWDVAKLDVLTLGANSESLFPGQFGVTQTLKRNCMLGSWDDYRLDGSIPYSAAEYGGPRPNGRYFVTYSFSDWPHVIGDTSCSYWTDYFNQYFMFRPDTPGSIWVTLATATLDWHGDIYRDPTSPEGWFWTDAPRFHHTQALTPSSQLPEWSWVKR